MPVEVGRGLPQAIRPDWATPPRVLSLMSTRQGGVSQAPFDSLNLRPSVLAGPLGQDLDSADAVQRNQQIFAAALGATPVWLNQVHGAAVVELALSHRRPGSPLPVADAAISQVPGLACTVLVADCLPVLFCSRQGRVVGAAHAGWRGLAAGVLEATVHAMCGASGEAPDDLLAWLGPCIGPTRFEVGADVLSAFGARAHDRDQAFFRHAPRPDGQSRWLADLPGLARQRLLAMGLGRVSGRNWCTVSDPSNFFSYRRDGRTGRLAAGIALAHRT